MVEDEDSDSYDDMYGGGGESGSGSSSQNL